MRKGTVAMRSLTNAEIIDRVELYQEIPHFHELTCRKDGNHVLKPQEQSGVVVLVCPECNYVQSSVPDVVMLMINPIFDLFQKRMTIRCNACCKKKET